MFPFLIIRCDLNLEFDCQECSQDVTVITYARSEKCWTTESVSNNYSVHDDIWISTVGYTVSCNIYLTSSSHVHVGLCVLKASWINLRRSSLFLEPSASNLRHNSQSRLMWDCSLLQAGLCVLKALWLNLSYILRSRWTWGCSLLHAGMCSGGFRFQFEAVLTISLHLRFYETTAGLDASEVEIKMVSARK